MDEHSKQPKNRLRWIPFKRSKQTGPPNISKTRPLDSLESSDPQSDYDTQRTRNRHIEACKLLRMSIDACRQDNTWEFLEFPELEGEPILFDQKFLQKLNGVLESRKKDIKDETIWYKCRETIECIFTALIPFSKNFLMIATNAQSVLIMLASFSLTDRYQF
jgi:hypothetical protein